MQPLPSLAQRFVNEIGRLLPPWNFYLQQFTQAPPNFMDITVGASPFDYVAKEPGNLAILGGTASAIHLLRGSKDLNLTGALIVPVAIADTVRVTYSVLPSISFIPSYGANTTK